MLILCHLCAPDARHGCIGFNIYHAGSGLALVEVFLASLLFLPLGRRFTLCHWILEYSILFFHFYRGSQLRVLFVSQKL